MEDMEASDSPSRIEAEICEEVVIDIAEALLPGEWPEWCIYKVPKQLRNVKEEAYTPKLVSIGPFHHGGHELRDMEKHKLRYLRDFCYATGKSQKDLLGIIEAKEVKIRHCYSEDCHLNSEDFVKMILLDAIFIIELFLKTSKKENDYIVRKPWLRNCIYYDLILLENQLPFFVLEDLYRSAFNDSSSLSHQQEGKQVKEHQGDLNKEDARSFLELSHYFFSYYDIDMQQKSNISGEVKHFTDLQRYLFIPADVILKPTRGLDNLYSATKLEFAGLEFKAVEKRRLLGITFSKHECLGRFPCFNLSWLLALFPCLRLPFPCLERMQGILEVPRLRINDDTESLFRNLMALEQCHYPSDTYICSYVMLISYLIKTEKDVDLLVEKNVIVNYMGSNAAVATLFNKLCFQIGEVSSCYYDLGRLLKRHHEHPWNHNMAVLRHMYFRDFGRGIATVAALLTLVGLFVPFVMNIGSKRK